MADKPRIIIECITLDESAFRKLEALRQDLDRRDQLLGEIGRTLAASVRKRFETMRQPDGKPWKPLSAVYLRRKKKNKDKILTLEARLRNQIIHQIQGDTVTVGTNIPYAAAHQFGATLDIPEQTVTRKRGTKGKNAGRFMPSATKAKHAVDSTFTLPAHQVTVPARPFLGLSAEDREEVREIIKEHLQRALNGA